MARRIPTVQGGCLQDLTTNGKLADTIVAGSAEWFAWLEHHCSFRFETDCTAFTARKEQRPGGWYWYGYRRKQGKLRSAYLGKSEELTLGRLSSIAEILERDHEDDGSILTSAIHLHKISRDDSSHIHQAPIDSLPTTFIEFEQITKPDSALKRPSRKLHNVEISPLQSPSSILLTRREHQVLCLLALGLTSVQIAEQLVVSSSTVNTHVRSIYNKLEVTSRSAATLYAVEHHLV